MEKNVISYDEVQKCIVEVRGQRVLIDRDVAALYCVETKRVNEAVRNNPDKFPDGYVLTLQSAEKQQLVENFDRFESLKHATVVPHAFTEKGLYMLATILKSGRATQTSIAIIEAFTKMRELAGTIREMTKLRTNTAKSRLCRNVATS